MFFSRKHQKCPWTSLFRNFSWALFQQSSRASGCLHGHFLAPPTGTIHGSRAPVLGNVHGHFSRFSGTFSSKQTKMLDYLCFCGLFLLAGLRAHFPSSMAFFFNVNGTFKVDGKFFAVHGHFIGCTGKVFPKFHGQMYLVHGHICKIVYGHFFEVHGRKKNVLVQIWRLLSFHWICFSNSDVTF